MRQTNTVAVAQAAAFALYDGLQAARALSLAPASSAQLTCLGPVEPEAIGLSGDAALEAAVTVARDVAPRPFWIHAATDPRGGPVVSAMLRKGRPALSARFASPSFTSADGRRWILRERMLFPSADGLHAQREAAMRRLASAWEIELAANQLVVGEWDAFDHAWDPQAVRRFAAIAWLLEGVRAGS